MPVLSNPRHELFSQYRALSARSVSKAYRLAGGEAKDAQKAGEKIAALPEVKDRIAELQAEMAEKAQEQVLVTQEEVTKGLLANARGATIPAPKFNSKGEPTGEFTVAWQGSNRAWELLGVQLGMFARIVKHADKTPFENMSKEEIEAVVIAAASELGFTLIRPGGTGSGPKNPAN